jgi:hypothetical protein
MQSAEWATGKGLYAPIPDLPGLTRNGDVSGSCSPRPVRSHIGLPANPIGRKAGTVAGFDYSEANKNSNVVWDEVQLDQYLSNPKQFMPGTKMIYPGMKDPEQRKALIAYLRDPK